MHDVGHCWPHVFSQDTKQHKLVNNFRSSISSIFLNIFICFFRSRCIFLHWWIFSCILISQKLDEICHEVSSCNRAPATTILALLYYGHADILWCYDTYRVWSSLVKALCSRSILVL